MKHRRFSRHLAVSSGRNTESSLFILRIEVLRNRRLAMPALHSKSADIGCTIRTPPPPFPGAFHVLRSPGILLAALFSLAPEHRWRCPTSIVWEPIYHRQQNQNVSCGIYFPYGVSLPSEDSEHATLALVSQWRRQKLSVQRELEITRNRCAKN